MLNSGAAGSVVSGAAVVSAAAAVVGAAVVSLVLPPSSLHAATSRQTPTSPALIRFMVSPSVSNTSDPAHSATAASLRLYVKAVGP